MSLFFIYSSLPPIDFGSKPDISTPVLLELFQLNMSKREMSKAYTLKLWIDIQNIYAFLMEGSFDIRGNYTKNTLKNYLTTRQALPDYVFEFLTTYETEESQKKNFNQLMSGYYQGEKKAASGFLREFLEFEYHMWILIAGYRCKKLKRDLGKELRFEDTTDPVVAMTLVQKDSPGAFVFPFDYRELEGAIQEAGPDPSRAYEALASYRFMFYSEIYLSSPFTLKAVLAYMMALWILEDYYSLKQKLGEEMLDQIVEKEHVS